MTFRSSGPAIVTLTSMLASLGGWKDGFLCVLQVAGQHLVEMDAHCADGGVSRAGGDSLEYALVVGDHFEHAPLLRQGQATVAIDLHLPLHHLSPDARKTADL